MWNLEQGSNKGDLVWNTMFRMSQFNVLFSLQLETEAMQAIDFYQLC